VTERQELNEKLQHLEELHRQAMMQQASEPTIDSPQIPTAEFTPEVMGEFKPEHVPAGMLSVANLDDDSRPEPDASTGPLKWEDEIPDEQQHQAAISRLDQLKANRVAADKQTETELAQEFFSHNPYDDYESRIQQQPQASDEPDSSPAIDGDAGLGLLDVEATSPARSSCAPVEPMP